MFVVACFLTWPIVGLFPRTISASSSPDLTVTRVYFEPLWATAGQSISVTFTVKNQGDSRSSSFSNGVFLATTERGTDYLLGNFSMDSLSAEAEWEVTFTTNPIPSSVQVPADYYLTVFTDAFRQVSESNEDNNIGSSTPTRIRVGPHVSVGDAVDNTTLSWTIGGNAPWLGQTSTYYYDGDAAQSGTITHDQPTWLRTTVPGPGTLTFYWKVSSESNYDFLRFSIDGTEQIRISGSVDWQQKSYSLDSGTHTLEWRYTKDNSVNSGNDCGWLDKVEFTSAPPTPTPTPTLTPTPTPTPSPSVSLGDAVGLRYWST